MIAVQEFQGKAVGVFGLARSGLSAARALQTGGAKLYAWDDNEKAREAAAKEKIALEPPNRWPWQQIKTLVLSPGIPLTHPEPHPVVRQAKSAGAEVIGDVELFARAVRSGKEGNGLSRIIAVTGTNGKSTTTALIGHILQVWREDGLPPEIPVFITELNIAWATGESFVDMFGGLWLADYVGAFLTAGGDGLYYFHYVPSRLHGGCNESYGTFGLFTVDANYEIQKPTSQYFASRLITQEWVQPGSGTHRIFPAVSDIRDGAGHVLVTAYAVSRPDGQWSVLLVNKDQSNAHSVRIVFHDGASGTVRFFSGSTTAIAFGAAQYQWHAKGADGFADPDGPPAVSTVAGTRETLFDLPNASVTVIRGVVGF